MKIPQSLVCIGVGVAIAGSSLTLRATPYASECTNNSGTIQYYLNETPTSVTITYEDGTHPASMTPATPAVGLNTFPLAGHNSYTISVNKTGAGTPVQISSDANTYCKWNSPRGVDINNNPATPLFGRIYIDNSAAGTKGKGFFVLNSDQSTLIGGTTGVNGANTPTGVWQASSSSPYRMGVAKDGTVYVGDFTAAGATVWQFDPNFNAFTNQVLAGLGTNAGESAGVHGEFFGAPRAIGSTNAHNLVLWTADSTLAVDQGGGTSTTGYNTVAGEYNNANQYNIGSGPLPWATAPNLSINMQLGSISGLVEEVDVGAVTGNIYLMSERFNYAAPQLAVIDPTGMTQLWNSQPNGANTSPDYFNPSMTSYSSYIDGVTLANGAVGTPIATTVVGAYAVRVSPDEKYVAVGLINNPIYIMNLNSGIPDPNTLLIIPNYPNTTGFENLRGLSWDAADNVYTVSSGQGLLRVYSLGLTTTAVTTNDATSTNGSFTVSTPSVTATAAVTSSTAIAYQANNSYAANGATPTAVTIGINLNAAQAGTTLVNFTLGGTATNGVNYNASTNGVNLPVASTYTVSFPAGVTTETVTITPTATPASGPTLTAVLSLKSGAAYSAVSPSSATAYIASSGPQVLTVDAFVPDPTMYRGTPGDYAGFQIDRWGDTNIAFTIPASAFTPSGTALLGTDYTAPVPAISVAVGAISVLATNGNPVSSAFPYTYVGNKSIIVTMSGGVSPESVPFSIGPVASATMTLLDNANPPESVLWSDPLTTASSSTNWNLAFGSVGNGTAGNPAITLVKNYVSAAPSYSGVAANDYDVEYGYSLASDPSGDGVSNPPNGSSTALRVTVNKDPGVTYVNSTPATITGATGGVSLYPAAAGGVPVSFSGNYAVRFSELTLEDTGGSATEYTQFGINHNGTNANWWAGNYTGGAGNTNIDGLWYSLTCDAGGASFGDVLEFTSTTYPNAGWANLGSKPWSGYAAVFKHPPYDGYPTPGGGSFAVGYGAPANLWNDVEIKQFNNVVTLTINKTTIYSYVNTGLWKSGSPMLGYGDPFDSIGTYGVAYFSNFRVVQLNGPTITGVSVVGGNVVITFTSNDADATPASFGVLSSGAVTGPWASSTATITQSGATYTATTAYSATGSKYFVIKQTNIVH
jgi:hypothetical protein